jgi:uncharacterized protein (TIGR03085 family)
MGVAQAERRQLCELFDQLGPVAETLCEGWRTRDLAAHLALRERRLDAAPGILLKPLAGHTRKVQDEFAAKPWTELVDLVRSGPPAWSPYGVGKLDELVNTAEFFVHHEDVRRAQPGWEPRPPEPERDEALWRALGRVGRIAYRSSPVGIVLRRPDGSVHQTRRGPSTVTLLGEPGELLLHAFGRDQVRVEFDGEQPAVATVQGLRRGF